MLRSRAGEGWLVLGEVAPGRGPGEVASGGCVVCINSVTGKVTFCCSGFSRLCDPLTISLLPLGVDDPGHGRPRLAW